MFLIKSKEIRKVLACNISVDSGLFKDIPISRSQLQSSSGEATSSSFKISYYRQNIRQARFTEKGQGAFGSEENSSFFIQYWSTQIVLIVLKRKRVSVFITMGAMIP